jgi:Replication initiator protein A
MRAFGADNGKPSRTRAAWMKPLAPSTPAKEHAFGVDDGSLHRHSVPMFLVRVTSAARYRVIFAKHRRIYCISQLVAKMNTGAQLQKTLHLKAYDLLVWTNRNTDGRGYEQLKGALDPSAERASARTSRPASTKSPNALDS